MKKAHKIFYLGILAIIGTSGSAFAVTKRVTILPFENVNNSVINELNFAIADSSTNALNNQPNFIFNSQKSINYLNNKFSDKSLLAKALKSDILISGNMAYKENTYSINSSIINTLDNKVLAKINFSNKNFFELQNSFVSEIIRNLKINKRKEDEIRIKIFTKPTSNIDAYYSYIRGRKESLNPSIKSYSRAADYYREAYYKDSKFNLSQLYEHESNLFRIYEKRNLSISKNLDLRPSTNNLNVMSLVPSYYLFNFIDFSLDQDENELINKINSKLKELIKVLPIEDTYNSFAMIELMNYENKDQDNLIKEINQAVKINPNNSLSYFLMILNQYYMFSLQLQEEDLNQTENAKDKEIIDLKIVDKAFSIDPLFLEIHYLLGSYLFQKGKINDSLFYLKNTTNLNNLYIPAHLHLGDLYKYKNEFVLSEYEYTIGNDDKTFTYNTDKSNKVSKTLEDKFIKESIESINELKKDSSEEGKDNLFSIYINLGAYYLSKNNYSESIKYFKEAEKLNEKFESLYIYLANTYSAMNNKEDSISTLKKGLKIFPESFQIKNKLAVNYYEQDDLDSSLKILKEIFPNPILFEVYKGSEEVNTNVIKISEKAIQKGNLDPDLYFNLVKAYENMGQDSKAIEALKKLSLIDPNNAIVKRELGILIDVKNIEEAIKNLEESYFIEPNDKQTVYQLIYLYNQNGNYEKGIKILSDFLDHKNLSDTLSREERYIFSQTDSLEAIFYEYLGYFYFKLKDNDNSISTYLKAIGKIPEDPNLYNGLGYVYYNQGKYKLALENFNNAKKNNNSDIINRNLALTYKALNNAKESYNFLKKVLLIENNKIYSIDEIDGLNFLRKGLNDKAIFSLNNSLNLKKQNADIYNNLAIAKLLSGKEKEALSDFQKSLELDPESGITYLNLGIYYDYTGKNDLAKQEYKRSCELNINQACEFNK